MSDDEMPLDMGTYADDADDTDDDVDVMPDTTSGLPEGVKKEVLQEAAPENYKTPKKGDEVTVHYVGTLEADGSEFDSSRGRNEPFKFFLGKGQVIKGWDVGVATMKKNEVAKFTFAPEFGYGESGSPPKIPGNSTLVFEIELLDWASKNDLFKDGGAIKTIIKEGKGYKMPRNSDEVALSMKVTSADGEEVLEERPAFEFVVGSDALGVYSKSCNKMLLGMKENEVSRLDLSGEYVEGDKPVAVTLVLETIFETTDVSFHKDKSLMKKRIRTLEGDSSLKRPAEGGKVTLFVETVTDGAELLPGFTPKTLEFTAGNGEVCDALECAISEMQKGERALVTVTKPFSAVEPQLGLSSLAGLPPKTVFTMELKDFENTKETWSMSDTEKVSFAAERKEVGGQLFKAGRFDMALGRYKKVVDQFSYVDNMGEEEKVKAKDLKQVCELNKAACYIKIGDFVEAKKACTAVLVDSKDNMKALFRMAQADHNLKNFMSAIEGCKQVIGIDPQNREARNLLKQAQEGQRDLDSQAKHMFSNMCKALGKGPIPEPEKIPRPGGDNDVDMDMDEEESEADNMEDGAGDIGAAAETAGETPVASAA